MNDGNYEYSTMTLQGHQPDVEADVTFLPTDAGGRSSAVRSGYRPAHLIAEDYLTTGVHQYLGVSEVEPGATVRAHITFLSPDAYPNSLWVGKILAVQEGSRVVGSAKIVEIMNVVLRKSG
jgi:translation elongation factor EF-Tu-like GTPase